MSNNENKLVDVYHLTGKIRVVTGLRIGANQETMEISGLDNPILRNPRNAEPYIPGSSLKGKMRSLAEWYYDEIPPYGEVTKVDPAKAPKTSSVFGMSASKRESDNPNFRRGPTRLIVRDAHLSQGSREENRNGRVITEVKSENSINRYTSVANPRPIERVTPDVLFDLDIVYRIFSIDGDQGQGDRDHFESVVLLALRLVEIDALGGGGSRGNGKVKFENLHCNGKPIELPALDFSLASS
jgi:CRISPR-associated protein Csm3